MLYKYFPEYYLFTSKIPVNGINASGGGRVLSYKDRLVRYFVPHNRGGGFQIVNEEQSELGDHVN